MKSEVTRLQEALLAAQEYADAACHALEASRGERALAASQAAAALVEQVREREARIQSSGYTFLLALE
jgi:hypothetical protein